MITGIFKYLIYAEYGDHTIKTETKFIKIIAVRIGICGMVIDLNYYISKIYSIKS